MTAAEAARFLVRTTNETMATEADVIRSQMIQDVLAVVAVRRLGDAITALKSLPHSAPDPFASPPDVATWHADEMAVRG